MDHTRFNALVACRDAAGSDSQLARDLGLTQPTIWRWMKQTKQMPAEYVLSAEELYGVSRHLLRPDIYPHEIDLAPPPSAYGEPYVECGPILSARILAGHDKRPAKLSGRGAA